MFLFIERKHNVIRAIPFECTWRGGGGGGSGTHGLSQYLETGCPNRGFIDFCVSKVWSKVHTTNKINPIYLQILLFYASNCFVCLIKVTLQLLHLLSTKKSHHPNSDKKN